MKKLLYSIGIIGLIFCACLFSLSVKCNNFSVVAGVYEWNFDVFGDDVYTDLDFTIYNSSDTHIYHNFDYTYYVITSGNSTLTQKTFKYFGYNWWNEEWELGTYDTSTGQPVANSNTIRSKSNEPIRVLPNTEYYFYGGNFVIFYYDHDNNYIGNEEASSVTGFIKRTPDDAYYLRFRMSANYGAVYNNNICINKSNLEINGNYYGYYQNDFFSFNSRVIQLLNDVSDDLLDDFPTFYDILVTYNHIKSVNGWYTFNTSVAPINTIISDPTYPNISPSTNESLVEWNLTGVFVNPINLGYSNMSNFDEMSFTYNYNTTYVSDIEFYDHMLDELVIAYYYRPPYNSDSWNYMQASKLLLQNQYVPEEIYNWLYQNGTFNYIGDFNSNSSTFSDVVNTIVSVPINYLRQLFNINLLGTSLFVIICSVLTIALVIYVIKKI